MILTGKTSAIIIADQRLDSLGNARHGHDDDGADVGDDGIADDEFFIQVRQNRMVEQEDYYPGGEFCDSRREPNLHGAPCQGQGRGEAYQLHMCLFTAKMCQVQKDYNQL